MTVEGKLSHFKYRLVLFERGIEADDCRAECWYHTILTSRSSMFWEGRVAAEVSCGYRNFLNYCQNAILAVIVVPVISQFPDARICREKDLSIALHMVGTYGGGLGSALLTSTLCYFFPGFWGRAYCCSSISMAKLEKTIQWAWLRLSCFHLLTLYSYYEYKSVSHDGYHHRYNKPSPVFLFFFSPMIAVPRPHQTF